MLRRRLLCGNEDVFTVIFFCFLGCVNSCYSQSSISIHVGAELNTAHISFDRVDPEELIYFTPRKATTSPAILTNVEHFMGDRSLVALSSSYSRYRNTFSSYRGVDVISDDLGFQKLTVNFNYGRAFSNFTLTAGPNVDIVFRHYQNVHGGGKRYEFNQRPDRFNLQFGVNSSLAYNWKRFGVRATGTFGLAFREQYVEYINNFNTYTLSVFYRILDKRE